MVTHNLDNLDYAERVINIFDGRVADDFELNSNNLDDVKKALITEKPMEMSRTITVLKRS